MNAAVVICLDRNKLVEQEYAPPAMVFYEMEAVRCIKSWRGEARWAGPIYAVQYEGRTVSRHTEDALAAQGVLMKTLRFDAPKRSFMDVVQALEWAESGGVAEDRIIYSDLDIRMEGEVPPEFTVPGKPTLYHYVAEDQKGSTPEFAYRFRQAAANGYFCHNTYFQAFDRHGGFQHEVMAAARSPEYAKFFSDNVYFAPKDDDYFFEEGAYDFVCATQAERFRVLDLPCPDSGGFFSHRHVMAETILE